MTTCAMSTALPMFADFAVRPNERWFSSRGCVVHRGDERDVFVGGTLIGTFRVGDDGHRNAILIGLLSDKAARVGKLAAAFGLVPETLRVLRKVHEKEGLGAVVARKRGGSESKVTPQLRARLHAMFDAGLGATVVQRKLRGRLSLRTVTYARAAWRAETATVQAPVAEVPPSDQMTFALESVARIADKDDANVEQQPCDTASQEAKRSAEDELGDETTSAPSEQRTIAPALESVARVADKGNTTVEQKPSDTNTQEASGSAEEGFGDETISATHVRAGRFVQHLGTWLMLASVARLGLHRRADEARGDRVEDDTLRIAIDSVVCALSVGEGCVEGVRRLATPSASALLRADHAPSATWTRRVLGRFSDSLGAVCLHLGMSTEYIEAARVKAEERPVVFYVDNHMRPYTGAKTIRRGWRMQDKRVRPGITDYYVHDEDGRPVLRIDVPSHDSLTDWLSPIAERLRLALGPDVKILLAFDRAGAFPEQMAELRNDGFQFVTYERRPFTLLSASAFDHTLTFEDETIQFADARTNLGKARGRVRRIAMRVPDGRQVNLLAVSDEDAPWLIGVMRGRWAQENGFKHGVERWGLNQLDARKVVAYPPDTIVPNPARRRLDRALRLARAREGEARRALASLPTDHPRRARVEKDLADAIEQQRELEALRPSTPKKAPLANTELADKLVKHASNYKTTLDSIRIACANAEADLAGELAPFLSRPREAKRALRNLLLAPGHIRLGKRTIAVTLLPAGNSNELDAFDRFLDVLSRQNHVLPGDPLGRRLRFRSQSS